MKLFKRIAAVLMLVAVTVLLVKSADAYSGTYSWGSVTTAGTTAVVPFSASIDTLTMIGCVVTIDYNGAIADFASVTQGNDVPTWEILAVNDDQHAACNPADPINRLTVLIVGDVWCTDEVTGTKEILRVTFNKVTAGTTVLDANVAVCNYKAGREIPRIDLGNGKYLLDGQWSPNNATTCDPALPVAEVLGNLTRNNGSVTFTGGGGGGCAPNCELEKMAPPTIGPIDRWVNATPSAWATVKKLYR